MKWSTLTLYVFMLLKSQINPNLPTKVSIYLLTMNITTPSAGSFAITVYKDNLYLDLTSNLIFIRLLSFLSSITILVIEARDEGSRF